MRQSEKNTPKSHGVQKTFWYEGRIVLFTAIVTTLFTFALNSWQSSEQRTRDAAVEQNRLYLEVKRAANAHWGALLDFIQLHNDHVIKLMFDEATMPKVLITNCVTTASTTIITNCPPSSPDDKRQIVTNCTDGTARQHPNGKDVLEGAIQLRRDSLLCAARGLYMFLRNEPKLFRLKIRAYVAEC